MSPPSDPLLSGVARRIRDARDRLGLTRKALAARSGVSERFLAALEGGTGNVSIVRLRDVAEALELRLEELVRTEAPDEHDGALSTATPSERARLVEFLIGLRSGERKARRLTLLGLRGAGKSTLGADLAARLELPFVELNRAIESASGMSVSEIFSLYGGDGFRRLERQALEATVAEHEAVIIAAPGGIVESRESYEVLLDQTHAIWLRAQPEEHMSRVRAQGDQRPMAGHPKAMDDLRAILERRGRAYGRAPHHFDTSGHTYDESARALEDLVRSLLGLADDTSPPQE